ncbi:MULTISPECIES: YmfQ family protein [Serratia]|uniref:YmfQ family protein n=2 Tax=Serratia TaxID=613 RepID=UPI000660749E|nr:putative phage tail protein [Serratia sp. 506_PEND]
MSYATLLGNLLPPVAYDPNGEQIKVEHHAEGNALQQVEDAARCVALGIVPLQINELIPDWERVLALTPAPDASPQERLTLIKAKINTTGGLSRPYFINLAKSLGYTITIDEPQPFRIGINRMGDRLYSRDTIWIWRVNVLHSDNLVSTAQLESMFQDLKPAHTFCHFIYKEA